MFYLDSSQMEAVLRFGDVIQGFPICFSVIDKPSHQSDFNITVSAPTYAVVLSPCCSIKDKVVAVAPLKQLENKLFANSYLAEDPTRINIKIPAEKSVPSSAWEKMDPGKKANHMVKGAAYVFQDKFIYAPNDLLPKYTINRREGNIETGCYAVDFRDSIKIGCDHIGRQYSPDAAKVLQLTVETRDLLRRKIVDFYQRIPDEDRAILAS